MPPSLFGVDDLVGAWRAKREFADAHSDLRSYHDARYRAFAASFGVDLDVVPASEPPLPAWLQQWLKDHDRQIGSWGRPWHRHVHALALSADTRARTLHGPFDGFLEAPVVLHAIFDRYGSAIEAPLHAARLQINGLVSDLLLALHPELEGRRVSGDDLRSAGFDPRTPAPDPDDYW